MFKPVDPNTIPVQERVEMLMSIAEDVQGGEELKSLLEKCTKEGRRFVAYNGFEPSGRMHIAQALITAINTNKITRSGGRMVLYIADYYAQLNHKMGGDLAKIKRVGEYFIEVFRACGMDLSNIEFVWASDFITQNQTEYFEMVNQIMGGSTLARLMRTCTIMGRKEGDKLSVSQLLYPCMQATDVFMLGGKDSVDICQLGVDQRKVNMLARELAPSLGRRSPIILSHHMLMGLKGKEVKMSKSDPLGAIFIEDTREEIFNKIRLSVCPIDPSLNPLVEYVRFIILPARGSIVINNKEYTSYQDVASDFLFEGVTDDHLTIFREAVANAVDSLIQPVRDHFNSTPELRQLLSDVEKYRVTR